MLTRECSRLFDGFHLFFGAETVPFVARCLERNLVRDRDPDLEVYLIASSAPLLFFRLFRFAA